MKGVWIRTSLALWARTIRSEARSQHSNVIMTFYTGFIGTDSYRDAFTLLRPVTALPLPKKPSNVYDKAAARRWKRRVKENRERTRDAAVRIARFVPPREWGTDLRGCLLRSRQLGARSVFIATDLEPWGRQQTAPLRLSGMKVSLLFFCSLNNAARCMKRQQVWLSRLARAGADVRLIDPAEVAAIDDVF